MSITSYNKPITVDVIIRAPGIWAGDRAKVDAIKAMRIAGPIGLKEAKDIIETASLSGAVSVRMTAACFGRLCAEFMTCEADVRLERVCEAHPVYYAYPNTA